MRDVPRDELREATFKFISDAGRVESYQLGSGVAQLVGVDYSALSDYAWGHLSDKERWNGRVERMAKKLADRGLLYRVGKGERTPAGHYASYVQYYTPKVFEDEAADAALLAQRQAVVEGRWTAVAGRLRSLGYSITHDRLTLDDWERLLGTTRVEFWLVRVQGGKRSVYAHGSQRYVEDMFMLHAAHTPPASLTEHMGKEPVTWQIEEVQVAEHVVNVTVKTDEQVDKAKAEAAKIVPPEVLMAQQRLEAEAGEH